MPDFVQLWVYLSSAPLVGLTATLVVYLLAMAGYQRAGHAPWANPVLWSIVVIGAGLLASGVPYPSYFAGAQFIHFLLGPSLIFGQSERIALSAGLMGGRTDRLGQGYQVGDSLISEAGTVPLRSVYELGFFVGLSFNVL